MGTYQRKEREAVLLHCYAYQDIRRDFTGESVLNIIDQLVEYSLCEKEGRVFEERLSGPEMYAFRSLKATADEGIGSFNRRRNAAIDNRGQQPTKGDGGQPESATVDNMNDNEETLTKKEKENENVSVSPSSSRSPFDSRLDWIAIKATHYGLIVSECDLIQWLNKYDDAVIEQAFYIAKTQGRTDAKYVQGILKNITNNPYDNA